MSTTVVKFGGTSLADASQMKKVAAIIEQDPARKYAVASAPGKRFPDDIKITDLLYSCSSLAESDQNFEPVLKKIERRFQDIIDELGIAFDLKAEIDVIRDHLLTGAEKHYMASRGEYLNSRILAAYLNFDFVDPVYCIHFNEDGTLNSEKTREDLARTLSRSGHAVVAGFYGSLPDGSVHTFSRGGSDVTGGLVAEAVGADLYENWTDVSGLLAADPRVIENPRVVDFITYRELRILSYMGASVLHTDAVLPACRAGIPINIRNTNAPEDPGTMIVSSLPAGRAQYNVTGVAGRKGLSVVQAEKVMASDGAGYTALLLDIFKQLHVPFEQCLTGIDTISVVIRSDLFAPMKDRILRKIRDELTPDALFTKEDLAMITVVGEGGPESSAALVRMLRSVSDDGVEISTINQGAGDLNLIIGVREEDYEKTLKAIYRAID